MKNISRSFALILALFCVLAVSIQPALAAPQNTFSPDVTTSVQPKFKDFTACIVADIKMMPKAKKLSPQGYQDFEKALNDAFIATLFMKYDNPYWAAVMTGAKLGKFIGYDMIWYIGAVQDCWKSLRR